MHAAALIDAIRQAAPGGHRVQQWSVCVTGGRRMSLGTKDRETGNPHAPLTLSESLGASYLLVWDDGRVSRGSLQNRELQEDPAAAVVRALQAAYDDPDAARVCGPAEFPEIELTDERVSRAAAGEVVEFVPRLEAVRRLVDEHGFRTWSGSMSASAGHSRVMTSAGLDVRGEGTSWGWHVSFNGEWGDGYGARALDDEQSYAARLARLADLVRLLDRELTAAPAGTQPVLLHPHVVESFVLSTLLHNLQASTVAHGTGRFRRDQFGGAQPVLREDLGLQVDPFRPLRAGAYRFTGEGVPACRTTFVADGRLIRPVAGLKYANRLGIEPTGVPYSMDAVEFSAGDSLSLEQAYAAAAGGSMVLSVLGVHTLDPSSGDFSLSAPHVLRLGQGGPEGRLRGTISGNLFSVLSDEALRFVRFPGETTPALLFPCRFDPS